MKLVEEAESMIERGAARNWIELGSVGNKKIGREKGRALNDERGSFSLISFLLPLVPVGVPFAALPPRHFRSGDKKKK